jgi:LytS/YehU family sensor histidine kinase
MIRPRSRRWRTSSSSSIDYLQLEEMRFGERLMVIARLSPRMSASVDRAASLLLQPLVEAAIRDGVEPSSVARSGCRIGAPAARMTNWN